MENGQLSSELEQLERALANRMLPEASAQLRQRVLADVRSKLRAKRRQTNLQFAAVVAAAALLWMNLSMSATQATDFGFRRNLMNESSESIETVARQIQQLAPEFSPEEARREAILMRAGSDMLYLPDLTKKE